MGPGYVRCAAIIGEGSAGNAIFVCVQDMPFTFGLIHVLYRRLPRHRKDKLVYMDALDEHVDKERSSEAHGRKDDHDEAHVDASGVRDALRRRLPMVRTRKHQKTLSYTLFPLSP